MLSYKEFVTMSEKFESGETYISLKKAILDKYNSKHEKVGKYILEKGIEFEVQESLEHDIVLKNADVYLIISKKEAVSLFKLL